MREDARPPPPPYWNLRKSFPNQRIRCYSAVSDGGDAQASPVYLADGPLPDRPMEYDPAFGLAETLRLAVGVPGLKFLFAPQACRHRAASNFCCRARTSVISLLA